MSTGIIPILNAVERETFAGLLANPKCKAKHAKRLQAVIGRADPLPTKQIAKVLRTDPDSISGWVHMYCVDEKLQMQSLQRSQPNLPMRPDSPERQTHDYHRHETTTLFAALDAVSGKFFGYCNERHRATKYRFGLQK